jgi:hypothetical protein
MNETEWLTCADPARMLAARWDLGEFASERKLRLFSVACIRRISHRLPDEHCRQAVDLCERIANGEADQRDQRAARAGVQTALRRTPERSSPEAHALLALRHALDGCAVGLVVREAALSAAHGPSWGEAVAIEQLNQAALFREIFGHPYRHVRINPSWVRCSDGAAIAQAAYATPCDNAPYLALADWVAENGAEDDRIWAHLHLEEPHAHVRGCWAIDLFLGLE